MNEKSKYPAEELGQIFKLIRQIQRTTIKYFEKYRKKISYDVPQIKAESKRIREIFKIFKGKYTIEIMHTLHILKNPYFNDLKTALPEMSSRILTDRLRLLEEHAMVERIVHETYPVRVSYKLSFIGKKLYLITLPLLFYMNSLYEVAEQDNNKEV